MATETQELPQPQKLPQPLLQKVPQKLPLRNITFEF